MTALELLPPPVNADHSGDMYPSLADGADEDEFGPIPLPLADLEERPSARGMTAGEFLALPQDDGVDRELILGNLWERPMSYRNRRHARAGVGIPAELRAWNRRQPEPRGEVVAGDAGFQLPTDPDTIVGIDAAYVSVDLSAATPDDVRVFVGAPVLAVEIVSPSNTYGEITRKIESYLRAGVAVTWIADPVWRTVTVHRPDAQPVMFNADQEIDAESHLPGFRAKVADLFG